ncbi:hypothetical protein ACET8U_06720 [Aeromonas veronii]
MKKTLLLIALTLLSITVNADTIRFKDWMTINSSAFSDNIYFSNGSSFQVYISDGGNIVWFTIMYQDYQPATEQTRYSPPTGVNVTVNGQQLYAQSVISNNSARFFKISTHEGRQYVINQLKIKPYIRFSDDEGWSVDVSAAGANKAISLAIKKRPL